MLRQRIEALLKLKEKLTFDYTPFADIARQAEAENPWFTREYIEQSVKGICNAFLDENELIAFAATYPEISNPKNIGIVLAGNIPMVGFHDIMCGILSGHNLHIKVSSKDKALITFIVNELSEYDSSIKERIHIAEKVNNCDAYIATGSNQSNIYFEQYFGKYPNILRKSRSSIAIIRGNESSDDLLELGKDVHFYFGLGCRNVSKVYVPRDYDFIPMIEAFKNFEYLADMHKYKNNLDYNLSLLLLNQKVYMSTQALLLIENENTHAPISVLHYEFYNDEQVVKESVNTNNEIQAIVGANEIPFGSAQQPAINDFADGVDTMKFLTEL